MANLTTIRLRAERKRNSWILLICALIILACITVVILIYAKKHEEAIFSFDKNLHDTAVTIDNTNIGFQEASYYILLVEANVTEKAYEYDPERPDKYWNLYINNTFIRDEAKECAINSLIRDNIYCIEADRFDVFLTTEDYLKIEADTDELMKSLTGKQMDVCDFDHDSLYNILKKIALATKYVSYLKETYQLTNDELDIAGSYYLELTKDFDIEVSDYWNDFSLGDITVTY